ncbi:uncharacterized protein [Rutidosis leptorrhynchoides]|uniref:uncharacterized protein n=1 Tax=Rutidosis leptorrhynchoides TaxID=125765 RepID=UPI003A990B5E
MEGLIPTRRLSSASHSDGGRTTSLPGIAGASAVAGTLAIVSVGTYGPSVDGTALLSPFDVNWRNYERGYYLGDGIYPDWDMLVKAPHAPTDEPRKKFKRFQESVRKDIERAFRVLQGRFTMFKTPARSLDFNKIRRHMYACVALHNMIQENNDFVIGRREERMIGHPSNQPRQLERNMMDRYAMVKEIRDRQVHNMLTADLIEHVWNLSPYFRSANDV